MAIFSDGMEEDGVEVNAWADKPLSKNLTRLVLRWLGTRQACKDSNPASVRRCDVPTSMNGMVLLLLVIGCLAPHMLRYQDGSPVLHIYETLAYSLHRRN
jgi:hypothetical protein